MESWTKFIVGLWNTENIAAIYSTQLLANEVKVWHLRGKKKKWLISNINVKVSDALTIIGTQRHIPIFFIDTRWKIFFIAKPLTYMYIFTFRNSQTFKMICLQIAKSNSQRTWAHLALIQKNPNPWKSPKKLKFLHRHLRIYNASYPNWKGNLFSL